MHVGGRGVRNKDVQKHLFKWSKKFSGIGELGGVGGIAGIDGIGGIGITQTSTLPYASKHPLCLKHPVSLHLQIHPLPPPILKSVRIHQIIHSPTDPPLHGHKRPPSLGPAHGPWYTAHVYRIETGSQVQVVEAEHFEALRAVPAQQGQATGTEGVDEKGGGEGGKEGGSDDSEQGDLILRE